MKTIKFENWLIEYAVEQEIVMNFNITEIDEHKLYLQGSIKWDGCSNWKFYPDNEYSMIHFCGLERVQDQFKLWSLLYELAAKEIPQWWQP